MSRAARSAPSGVLVADLRGAAVALGDPLPPLGLAFTVQCLVAFFARAFDGLFAFVAGTVGRFVAL